MERFNSKKSEGRKEPFDEDLMCNSLDPFMTDYLKILQSKAFRRLAYKTQVLTSPKNPHVRTRAVHTNEVVAISTIIAEKLNLNVNLCKAIALGHDIGHTPYGHLGEKVISDKSRKEFRHNEFGVVLAQCIERRGKGLNCHKETLEGIVNHSRGSKELVLVKNKPQEYNLVMISDKIAYTFSDINDSIRYGFISESNLPKDIHKLGNNQRGRVNSCIKALISESMNKGFISFSESSVFNIFNDLKSFMYAKVYSEIDHSLHSAVLTKVYDYFANEFPNIHPAIPTALLTDTEANIFGDYLLSSRKLDKNLIANISVNEILPYVEGVDPFSAYKEIEKIKK